jgi:hypothetical protein
MQPQEGKWRDSPEAEHAKDTAESILADSLRPLFPNSGIWMAAKAQE